MYLELEIYRVCKKAHFNYDARPLWVSNPSVKINWISMCVLDTRKIIF